MHQGLYVLAGNYRSAPVEHQGQKVLDHFIISFAGGCVTWLNPSHPLVPPSLLEFVKLNKPLNPHMTVPEFAQVWNKDWGHNSLHR
jgi:hypothetical protein